MNRNIRCESNGLFVLIKVKYFLKIKNIMMAKAKTTGQKKVKKVMEEYKEGKLKGNPKNFNY